MKYTVSTTDWCYTKAQIKDLEALGFTFNLIEDESLRACYSIQDESLRACYSIQGEGVVSLNTLEDLEGFISRWGEIVLNNFHIEIYDNYRE